MTKKVKVNNPKKRQRYKSIIPVNKQKVVLNNRFGVEWEFAQGLPDSLRVAELAGLGGCSLVN